jgi:hypothetical protein
MLSRGLLGLLGLFHVVNGLYMLMAPEAWYAAVPGVSAAGPFNHHFIVDIGLVFLASGAAMLAALRPGHTAAVLALTGSVWPALHALFHIWEWFNGHMPGTAQLWLSEGLGVVFVGFLGLALAWIRFNRGES